MRLNHSLNIILIAIASGLVGYALQSWLVQSSTATAATNTALPTIGQKRPDYQLPDLEGVTRTASEWDGRVVLVNFWATWCPPCRREIPMFIKMREKYKAQGFEIIGIAVDKKDPVLDYRDTAGITYPILIGDQNAMDIGRRFGNAYGALPYSVFIDQQGRIHSIKRGELSENDVITTLNALLPQ